MKLSFPIVHYSYFEKYDLRNIENLKPLALTNAGVHSTRKLVVLLGVTMWHLLLFGGLGHRFSFRGGIGRGKPEGNCHINRTGMLVVTFRGKKVVLVAPVVVPPQEIHSGSFRGIFKGNEPKQI